MISKRIGERLKMNEILVMFLFTIFMLLSFIVIGFSLKNQVIIICIVAVILIILIVFVVYMNYITKLANDKLKNSKDFDSFKLFINYILTSDTDLKLYINKDTAKQISKILNKEIYSVKDIYIYNVLDDHYTAEKIRVELLDELSCLSHPDAFNKLKKAYDDLATMNYKNNNMTLILLDTWCLNQIIYMRSKQTARIEKSHLDTLLFIIDSIAEMKIEDNYYINEEDRQYYMK